VIEYPPGMQGQARTVAEQVPGAAGQQTSSVQHVTLLLGADGLSVSTAHAPHGASHRPLAAASPSPSPSSSNGMTAADTGTCIN
jgi:hypothetical protein